MQERISFKGKCKFKGWRLNRPGIKSAELNCNLAQANFNLVPVCDSLENISEATISFALNLSRYKLCKVANAKSFAAGDNLSDAIGNGSILTEFSRDFHRFKRCAVANVGGRPANKGQRRPLGAGELHSLTSDAGSRFGSLSSGRSGFQTGQDGIRQGRASHFGGGGGDGANSRVAGHFSGDRRGVTVSLPMKESYHGGARWARGSKILGRFGSWPNLTETGKGKIGILFNFLRSVKLKHFCNLHRLVIATLYL